MEPSLLSSPASLSIMVVTVLASLVAFSNQHLWRAMALEPYRMVHERQYHAVITAGLIHANMGHLFINMLTLYFFGPGLEATVGGDRFLIIYLASLIVGNLYPLVKFRNTPEYVAIGASGAISGIVFSFCLFYPMAMFYVFFLLPMPAFVFAFLYVGYSIYAMRGRQDNIGHEAHLAGALGGVIATLIAFPDVIAHIVALFKAGLFK